MSVLDHINVSDLILKAGVLKWLPLIENKTS